MEQIKQISSELVEIGLDEKKTTENNKNEIKIIENNNDEQEHIPLDNMDRTRYNESLNIDTNIIKTKNSNTINKQNSNEENNLESSRCFHDLPLQIKSHQEIKKRKSFDLAIEEFSANKFSNSSEPFLFIEGGLKSET